MGMPDLVTTVVSREVVIAARFEGFHRWKGAPDDVAFLRDYHRHQFGVQVTINVTRGDREVEFFQAQRVLNSVLTNRFRHKRFEFSCEQLAERIGRDMVFNGFYVSSVSVDEDGENAGLVEFLTVTRQSGQPVESHMADALRGDNQLIAAEFYPAGGERPTEPTKPPFVEMDQ